MTGPNIYAHRRWRNLRQAHLEKEPLCRMCHAKGRVRLATIVDHIDPHKGDMVKFYNPRNLQSLCKWHHDSVKQAMEKGGTPRREIGLDGFPVE